MPTTTHEAIRENRNSLSVTSTTRRVSTLRREAALVILFAIAGLALGACNAKVAKEDNTTNDVPVATLLYVGFGFDKHTYGPVGGMGTRGWNVIQGDSLYEGLVVTQPEIGWYASKKTETIAWQLAQMQRAGIDVIFLSWQGWGDDNLDWGDRSRQHRCGI